MARHLRRVNAAQAEHPLIRAVITGLSPMRTTREECGASAAQAVSSKARRGGCGTTRPQHEVAGKFDSFGVDKGERPPLYSPHNGAPPAFRRDGAPAKLLTDSVTSRPISVGGLGLRRLPGVPGRGIAMVPGLFDK